MYHVVSCVVVQYDTSGEEATAASQIGIRFEKVLMTGDSCFAVQYRVCQWCQRGGMHGEDSIHERGEILPCPN